MTPYHNTNVSRIRQGHAQLNDWDTASIAAAANGIQVISGILLQHQLDAEFDGGDELLRLNSASVCGLLEAVNGLAELVELRLGFGVSRVLHTLQFILPDGSKRFLSGGRISGCYYAMGRPAGVLLLCEGYATGATLHQATGHAVAVAFNCGNLPVVARALRAKFSNAPAMTG